MYYNLIMFFIPKLNFLVFYFTIFQLFFSIFLFLFKEPYYYLPFIRSPIYIFLLFLQTPILFLRTHLFFLAVILFITLKLKVILFHFGLSWGQTLFFLILAIALQSLEIIIYLFVVLIYIEFPIYLTVLKFLNIHFYFYLTLLVVIPHFLYWG